MLRPVDRISRPQSSTVLPTGRSYYFRESGCRPFYLFAVFRPESTDDVEVAESFLWLGQYRSIFEFARQTQTYSAFGGNRV